MTGLKIFRLLPFCLLLLAGNVFAVVSDNGSVNNLHAERVRGELVAKAVNAEGVDDLLSELNSNNTSLVSGDDISNYARIIRDIIQNKVGGLFDNYKGKQCILVIHLSPDGSLSGFNTESGAPDLCSKLSDVMRSIKKFPPPPSDAVYQKIKDAKLGFNL